MQLVELLKKRLSEYRYTECDEGSINDIQFVAVIKTLRLWMVRYLCVVVEVPENISDIPATKQFFAQVRRSLTAKYAKFPYWKELGTYLVFLCEHELYKKLRGKEKSFKDRTGFHMNVMLGTCFVDKKTFENSAEATWGLFYSGKHYGAIRAAVAQWCKIQEKETNSRE